jgi:CHASE1-domain containing sensor protein
MDEELQRRALHLRRDGLDLRPRELARQHHLREAGVLQEARFLRRADVGLRAGVQLDRRQLELQQAHVLHDQRVGAGLVELPGQLARALELIVAQDRVDGDEDARAEAVRVARQTLDVGHRVAGLVARTEIRPADVDGIGTVVDRLDADVGVTGGSEQFEFGARHGGVEPAGPGLSPLPTSAKWAAIDRLLGSPEGACASHNLGADLSIRTDPPCHEPEPSMSLHLPSLRHAAVTALVVFLSGLGLTVAVSLRLRDRIELDAQAEFARAVERVRDEVVRRFQQPVQGLKGARGVYVASESVTRAEFRSYVASFDLRREFPGVRGFGFVERLEHAQLDDFVARERADGAPGFALRQLGDNDHRDLYVIKLIEPAAANPGALGLDIGSEAKRREAVREAIDAGEPRMTDAVTLVQDERRTPGVLVFVPYYRGNARPTTVEARRSATQGLLYAPIVVAELLAGISDVEKRRVDFELVDATYGEATGARMYPPPATEGVAAASPVPIDARDHVAT